MVNNNPMTMFLTLQQEMIGMK